MRLAILIPGFSAGPDDWCIPAQLSLARRLSAEAEVHVFPLRYPHHRQLYQVERITVHPLGGGETRGIPRLALLTRAMAAVMREHRRRPFDVLHAMWADEPGFVAALVGEWLGIPTVVSLLGGELVALADIGYGGQLSLLNRGLVRVALRRASRVLVGSAYLRRLAAPYTPSERLICLPIGVNTDLFRPTPRPDEPAVQLQGTPALLHAASLVPVKDQATLLRAVARIVPEFPALHLHLLGGGPLDRPLQAMTQSLGIHNHVTFHGPISHTAMPAYYRAADLCVLASRHEGQEFATLEAAACGRATVGTAVGLLPDLLPAPCVARPGDDEGLSAALRWALADPARLAHLHATARDVVLKSYTLEQNVANLHALYHQLSRT